MSKNAKAGGLALVAIFCVNLISMGDLAIIPGAENIVLHFLDNSPMWTIDYILSGAQFTAMLAAILSPLLMRKFSKKNLILTATVIYGIFGTAGGLVDNAYWVAASRFFIGFAMGIVIPCGISLIFELYAGDEDKSARYVGFFNGVMSLCGVVLTLIGGVLTVINWNTPFYAYIILAILAFIFFKIAIPYTPPETADTFVGEDGAASDESKYFAPKTKLAILAILMIVISIFYGVIAYKYSMYNSERGFGNETFGALLSICMSLGAFVTGFIFGPIFAKVGRFALPIAFAAMAVSFAGLYFAMVAWVAIIFFVIMGFAYGLCMAWFFAYAERVVPARLVSTSSAVITVANYLGLFLTTYFSTWLLGLLNSDYISAALPPTAILCAVFCIITVILGLVEKGVDAKRQLPEQSQAA